MAKKFHFDEFGGRGNDRERVPQCLACEEMLADALDGSLEAGDQAWFDGHVSTCSRCSEMLADAQRGAAWLEMLKTPRPQPSARLIERIMAETAGAEGVLGQTGQQPLMVPAMAPSVLPLGVPGNLIEFRPRSSRMPAWAQLPSRGVMFEPRLALTAAMAFFSIALTLNLTGVQLNRLHASDFNPSNLKRTYYTANAQAARYYDNLRVVHVLESRVEDLREAVADRAPSPAEKRDEEPRGQEPRGQKEDQPRSAPEAPGKREEKKPAVGPGVSRQTGPRSAPEPLKRREEMPVQREPFANMDRQHRAGGLG